MRRWIAKSRAKNASEGDTPDRVAADTDRRRIVPRGRDAADAWIAEPRDGRTTYECRRGESGWYVAFVVAPDGTRHSRPASDPPFPPELVHADVWPSLPEDLARATGRQRREPLDDPERDASPPPDHWPKPGPPIIGKKRKRR